MKINNEELFDGWFKNILDSNQEEALLEYIRVDTHYSTHPWNYHSLWEKNGSPQLAMDMLNAVDLLAWGLPSGPHSSRIVEYTPIRERIKQAADSAILNQSQKTGDARALIIMGDMLYQERNSESALMYYEAAHDYGSARGTTRYALALDASRGCKKKHNTVRGLLRSAVERGHGVAAWALFRKIHKEDQDEDPWEPCSPFPEYRYLRFAALKGVPKAIQKLEKYYDRDYVHIAPSDDWVPQFHYLVNHKPTRIATRLLMLMCKRQPFRALPMTLIIQHIIPMVNAFPWDSSYDKQDMLEAKLATIEWKQDQILTLLRAQQQQMRSLETANKKRKIANE